MKFLQRLFKNDLFPLSAGFIVNIITWMVIRFKIQPSSEIIPLHYNVFYGTDYAGKGYYLYLIPAVGLVFIFLNYFLYRYSLRRQRFAGRMMSWVALAAQFFILLAVLLLRAIINS